MPRLELSRTEGEELGLSKIEALSMKTLIDRENLWKIDLLKIDIEGSEFELFSYNVSDWLPNTENMAIEIHENLKPGVTAIINDKTKLVFDTTSHGEYSIYKRKK